MTQPRAVDANKLLSLAYGRIAELTLELDKATLTIEGLQAELDQPRPAPVAVEAPQS